MLYLPTLPVKMEESQILWGAPVSRPTRSVSRPTKFKKFISWYGDHLCGNVKKEAIFHVFLFSFSFFPPLFTFYRRWPVHIKWLNATEMLWSKSSISIHGLVFKMQSGSHCSSFSWLRPHWFKKVLPPLATLIFFLSQKRIQLETQGLQIYLPCLSLSRECMDHNSWLFQLFTLNIWYRCFEKNLFLGTVTAPWLKARQNQI